MFVSFYWIKLETNLVNAFNFVEDTTPPVLTFTRTGTLTINYATITWSVNEPASANCTLTTPYNTMEFDCNSGTWSGSNLLGGKYSLSILLLDLGNNSAGPFVHEWQNGKFKSLTCQRLIDLLLRLLINFKKNETYRFILYDTSGHDQTESDANRNSNENTK